jgi:NADH:ubiquinone reductase (H+-translocating)
MAALERIMSPVKTAALPTVVIVGAGFGGLRVARGLRRLPVRVLLLDRHNYHLFQPLLYQVATAGLEPEQIARPIRTVLRRHENFDFRMVEVTGVDPVAKQVSTSAGPVSYDYLVLSIGGATNFFGKEGVRKHAFELKDIPHALALRNHVLRCFEMAMLEDDPDRRRALLTFAVVGGGPTGVEMAGALSELIRLVLGREYPRLNLNDTRVLLLEAGDRLLVTMPPKLSKAAAETLWRKHVEVRFGAAVDDYNGSEICLQSGEVIPAGTLVWAAGVRAADLASHLGFTTGGQGRVRVEPTLQVPEHPAVFVIGDAAFLESGLAGPLPMVAPVAMQMADTTVTNIGCLLADRPLEGFRFRDPGTLATIGRNAAVAYIRGFAFKGFLAWIVWLVIHLIQIIGFRNKLMVLVNWAWDYFFYERGARLITFEPQAKRGQNEPASA